MNLIRCSPVVVSLMFLTNVPLLFEGGGRSIITIVKERKYWPSRRTQKSSVVVFEVSRLLKKNTPCFYSVLQLLSSEQIHEKIQNRRENVHTVELKFFKDPLTLKKCGEWKIDGNLISLKILFNSLG